MRRNITILIVEDNPDDLFFLKEVLADAEEIEPTIFHDDRLEGAKALAGKEKIDVAILDLSLPDSFGLDTFLSFREQFPDLPVVIMTGARDHEMAFQAVQQGAQDYLFKGELLQTTLVRTIRYAIERQRLTTALKMALEEVRELRGMLPICSFCKKIRDDQGYWSQIESYLATHSKIEFSHSLCPECARKHYPGFDFSGR